jgi:ABC-type multidrug transport system permease subunit
VNREDGYAQMHAGEASALVVLPSGFTDAVINERPATLTLVRNPSERFLPAIVQTGAEMLVDALFYLQRGMGEPLRQIRAGTPGADRFPSNADVTAISTSINDRLRRAGAFLMPPAMALDFASTAAAENPAEINFGVLFLPSMLFMAVLFISQGMADDVWSEKEDGTLRRAAVLPHALATFLAGKLVAAGAIMAAVGVAVLVVLTWMGAATIPRVPVALVWVVFAGTALYTFFLVLQVLASSRRGANALTNVLMFPMMMIGGTFFPFEAMPAWMRAIGEWTPNGLALVRFKDIIAGTATVPEVLGSALAIGMPAAALFLLAARLAGGRFASRD